MNIERVEHPLPPVFDGNSRILILGTMASVASRAAGFYYMHPQNRFYRALSALFDEEVPLDIAGKRAFLLAHGVALWDVLRCCDIVGSSDASIKNPVPNDVSGLLAGSAVTAVFTTGRTAYSLYQRLLEKETGVPAVCLPSPSPANCAMPFDVLVESYRKAILPALSAPLYHADTLPNQKDSHEKG